MRYIEYITTEYANGRSDARLRWGMTDSPTEIYTSAYIREKLRKDKSKKRGKLHDENRAKAKARNRAIRFILAAAINAKES